MTTKIDEALLRCKVDENNLKIFCKIRETLREYNFNPVLIADLDEELTGQNPPTQDYSSYLRKEVLNAKPLIDDLCSVILSQNGYQSNKHQYLEKIADMAILENNQFIKDLSELYLELKDECIERQNKKNKDEIIVSPIDRDDKKTTSNLSKFMQDEINIAERQKAIFFKELQNKLDEAFKAVHIAENTLKSQNIDVNQRKERVDDVHRLDKELGAIFINAKHKLTTNVMKELRLYQNNSEVSYNYDFCDRLVQYVMFDVVLLTDVDRYKKESEQLYNDFKNQSMDNNRSDDLQHNNQYNEETFSYDDDHQNNDFSLSI